MGYFRDAWDLSQPVVDGECPFYFFMGFMVLVSPLGVPLYWIGRGAGWVLEAGSDE